MRKLAAETCLLPPGDLVLLSKAVRLTEGQRVVLNTDILLASDSAGRPEELVYTVTVPPRHGLVHAVQRPGVPLLTFTQLDVAAHRVCYTHDNSHHAESDAFRSQHTHRKHGSLWLEIFPKSSSSKVQIIKNKIIIES